MIKQHQPRTFKMQRRSEFKQLTDDAFARPSDVKKDYLNNYTALYGEDDVICDYPKNPIHHPDFKQQSEELQQQQIAAYKKQCAPLKKQMSQLLLRLKTWGS